MAVTNKMSITVRSLELDIFENPVTDGSISVGVGDFNFDINNEFERDENGVVTNPKTNKAANELRFMQSYTDLFDGDDNYFFASFDAQSVNVYGAENVNYNGSTGEMNYLSFTSKPQNATVAKYWTTKGIEQRELWNGTRSYEEGNGDNPSRKVIYFSVFNKWGGIQSLSFNEIKEKFANLDGQFITMIFTINNIDNFVSWVQNELITFCKKHNFYILLNSPSNKGIDIGGDKHNKKWLETKELGYGTQLIYLGGCPSLNSTKVNKETSDLISLIDSLSNSSTKEFIEITDQYESPLQGILDLSKLNDGTYDD